MGFSLSLKKMETSEQIALRLPLYVNEVLLTLDKKTCIKCDICSKVCPKEAVKVSVVDEKLEIEIDKDKCVLCGVCVPFCPVGALDIQVDKQSKNILALHEGLPTFPEKILIDERKCPEDCRKCEEACPVEAIKVKGPKKVEVNKKICMRCPICLDACEDGAITVNPIFFGSIEINTDKCPKDCDLCVQVCPTKAIEMGENKKVSVKDRYCIFCGACTNICPEKAIDMRRTRVLHGEGFSSSWNFALEKLTSVRSVYLDHDDRARKRLVELIEESRVV
jgi:4Fe-4S ferredoxin